jgi:copper-binding protein NosD
MRRLARIAVLIGLLQTLGVPALRAETVGCTPVTSVPSTIVTPGIYCLTGNLATSITGGTAISIQANNVVLDLNGWILDGAAAGPDTVAVGISASLRQNITIRNGTVRGFQWGITFGDSAPYTTSRGHVVEGIRADQNTLLGIYVDGRGNIVRNNQVVATGSTVTLALASAYGILIQGPEARVLDNDVIATTKHGTGVAYGVLFSSSAKDGVAMRNRITQGDFGILFHASAGMGKYRDNLTSGVTSPYQGGSDAGNNQ